MLAFNAFFDTAGTENDRHVLIAVGVVARMDDLVALEEAWRAVLSEFGVRELHMNEYAHFKGDFVGWRDNPSRRAALLTRLIEESRPRICQVIAQGVLLSDYRLVNSTYRLTEHVGGAYSLNQILCMRRCLSWVAGEFGAGVPMNMLVQHGDSGQREMMRFLEESNQYTPILLGKRDTSGSRWVPLQLADLVAYEYRRLFEAQAIGKPLLPEQWRRSLQAIRRTLPVTGGITGAAHIQEWCVDFHVPHRS